MRRLTQTSLALVPLFVAACGARTSLRSFDASGGSGGATTATSTSHTGVTVATSSSTAQGGQGGNTFDATVISVDPNQSFFESETSLWAFGNTVVASWIAIPGGPSPSTMGYAVSTDGGASWSSPAGVSSPGGRDASDPVVAVDAKGTFYLAFVGFQRDQQGNPLDMHVYVSSLPAGTTTFSPPIEVSDPLENATLYDKPWITVSSSGTILVSYANFDQSSSFALTAARSTDGLNWQRSNITSDPTFAEFSNLAFLCADSKTPRVYSVFVTAFGQNEFDIRESFTDDGGVSWHAPLKVAGPSTGEIVTFDDPTCVAVGDDVSILYGTSDMPSTGMSESEPSVAIKLAHVTGGTKVVGTTEVQDPTAGALFIHPQLTGDSTGRLSVSYYAGQFDGDDAGSFRVGPVTWTGHGPTKAYREAVRFTSQRADPQWLGDYTGVFQQGSDVLTSFAVNQPSESHIAFARVPAPSGL